MSNIKEYIPLIIAIALSLSIIYIYINPSQNKPPAHIHHVPKPTSPSIPSAPSIPSTQSPQSIPSEKKIIIYYFHNPHCGFCIKFNPEWLILKNNFVSKTNIIFKEIDTSSKSNDNISFYYKVEATPSIIIQGEDFVYKLEGADTANNLSQKIHQISIKHQ